MLYTNKTIHGKSNYENVILDLLQQAISYTGELAQDRQNAKRLWPGNPLESLAVKKPKLEDTNRQTLVGPDSLAQDICKIKKVFNNIY
jgi:hypothetical protein